MWMRTRATARLLLYSIGACAFLTPSLPQDRSLGVGVCVGVMLWVGLGMVDGRYGCSFCVKIRQTQMGWGVLGSKVGVLT